MGVVRFLDFCIKNSPFSDLTKAARSSAKTFIMQIPDLFGLRGRWAIVKRGGAAGGFVFKIYDPELLDRIKTALRLRALPSELEKQQELLVDSDESSLATKIEGVLYSVGLTRDWVEKYRNQMRLNTVSNVNLFKAELQKAGFVTALFEYPDSHENTTLANGKRGTVLLIGIDDKNEKTLLHTETDAVSDDNYLKLKDKVVVNWMSGIA
jgi:hypothetical protein